MLFTSRQNKIILISLVVLTAILIIRFSTLVSAIQHLPAYAPQDAPFISGPLQAKSVYAFDALTGEVLYQKNSSAILPLASLTKIATAIIAHNLANEKIKSIGPLASEISITPESLKKDGDQGLIAGERWDVDDLIRLMLVASSNDAAAALSQDLDNITFVQKMNDFAHGLGLNSFLFKNETGLDNETETEAGDLGSAHDVAYLFRYFLSNFSYLLYPTR
ncbi:MAG: serine hydrolase, partial [Candidatus Pacebacteria bacterium]|nr:serine hydrolase [Candidatus Paceibacterota bacterium]